MLQYNIHLRTVILEIMSQGPVDSMILNLTKYTPAQIPELEHYMEEANFFNDLNTEDVSNIA